MQQIYQPRLKAVGSIRSPRPSTVRDHTVPIMQNPAHEEQNRKKINCQVCHAQWAFNDFGKHFLRSDTDNFDIWANISAQGNFEIETIVKNNNDFDKTELPAQMTDKITGEPESGLWYKGFTMRRWETIILGRDDKETSQPCDQCLIIIFHGWIKKK